ncbi:MAG: hypothetical protein KBD00_00690 [Candidatus Peribacteraceae bacterium]|nr:hypothetical protein [Candidatus Peribacteraceae bacterium]
MVTPLPASIEAHLREAGFTATELLVLKKLLEEDALTVREIAAKTVKSTGIIDQAIKKLLTRGIVARTLINDQPRYRLLSLDAITRWVTQDRTSKQLALDRRQKNFETFIATVVANKTRPDMEYFEGLDGICTAYNRLLEQRKEILAYCPMAHKEEEDPLREMRIDLFRKRRKQSIFLRILATESSLAHRFQSRDHFEYRQTKLLPESELFIPFEKLIVGDIIACIDSALQKACFIRYPEMADAERGMFEKLWNKKTDEQSAGQEIVQATEQVSISFKTRIASYIRAFGPSYIATFAFCSALALAATYGLYQYNLAILREEVGSRLMAIAITAAPTFDPDDLDAIHWAKDMKSDAYQRVFQKLVALRNNNEKITYAYILRPTDKKGVFEFIADADSNYNLPFWVDSNNDGKEQPNEYAVAPGVQYDGSTFEAYASGRVIDGPFVDIGNTIDQWGPSVGAGTQIKRGNEVVGILRLDTKIDEFYTIVRSKFVPWEWFFSIMTILAFSRLVLDKEMAKRLLKKIRFTRHHSSSHLHS